jgi:hypothetical protein
MVKKIKPEEVVFKTEQQLREEELIEGRDALLTPQIYGNPIFPPETLDTDVLPKAHGEFQGIEDPLQRFINMYEPGELVMRNNFRKHLLQVLEAWRLKDVDQN